MKNKKLSELITMYPLYDLYSQKTFGAKMHLFENINLLLDIF